MRVINLVTQLEPGGAQGAAIRMSQQMRLRGHSAQTWFLYKKFDCYQNEPELNVIADSRPHGAIELLSMMLRLWKEVRAFAPDCVIGYTHYANAIGLTTCALAGVRIRVATQRNPFHTYPKLAQWLDRVAGAIGIYSRNISVSNHVAETFSSHSKRYRSRMQVVYNGVQPTKPSASQVESRKRFNLPVGTLLVTAGRLVHQKNHELIINTLAQMPECHLAIAGEGELRSSLKQLAATLGVTSRLHLVGAIPPDQIQDFLVAGDIFLFPSRYEAFGFALLEATFAGLPVIASAIPSSIELFGPAGQDAGVVFVNDDDPDKWMNAIQRLSKDMKAREAIVARARKRAAHFSLSKMVDEYERAAFEGIAEPSSAACNAIN